MPAPINTAFRAATTSNEAPDDEIITAIEVMVRDDPSQAVRFFKSGTPQGYEVMGGSRIGYIDATTDGGDVRRFYNLGFSEGSLISPALSANGERRLTFDFAGRAAMPFLIAFSGGQTFIDLIIRQYLSSDLTTPAFAIKEMVKSAAASDTRLELTLTNPIAESGGVLKKRYNRQTIPSLL